MKNAYNFQDLEIITYLNKRKSYYRFIFLAFIIVILILIYKFKFYSYQKITLIKNNSNYVTISSITNENTILDNKYIFINNKKYKYKVVSISDTYNSYNQEIVEEIILNISKLNNKSKVIDASILINDKTLFDRVFEFIKGG